MALDWAAVSVLTVLAANLIALVWGAAKVTSKIDQVTRDVRRLETSIEHIASAMELSIKESRSQTEGRFNGIDRELRDLFQRVIKIETKMGLKNG